MRKIFSRLVAVFAFVLFFSVFSGTSYAASANQLKLMSTFLSNFTEVGLMFFNTEEIASGTHPEKLIRFGIMHNYINNYKSRIKQCGVKGCKWGSLTIEGKFVTESIKKYFDVDYTKLGSVTDSDPPYHYDGKLYHFEGADGELVYYARVDKAVPSGKEIIMTGVIYNAEDKDEIHGSFEAVVKPHKFGGRDTWAIIALETKFSASDSAETLKAVLRNEAELFYVLGGLHMTLGELHGGEEGPYMPLSESSFSVVDMDRDGIPEIVLHVGDNIVLHYKDNGIVYAYVFGARAMQMLRPDGSFHASGGAAGGTYLRVTEFRTDEEEYETETLAEYDAMEDGNESYAVQGKPVSSEEEFTRMLAELLGEDFIEQFDFTEENIERELTW